MSYNGIKVNHIVATDLYGCIGKDGDIPWHLSADLRRFKSLTEGGVVVMGRKTFDSINSKPLPNRVNMVLSTTAKYKGSNPHYYDNIHEMLTAATEAAKALKLDSIWIIGGESLYDLTEEYMDALYLTSVTMEVEQGTSYYNPKAWQTFQETKLPVLIQEDTETVFQFINYLKV